MLGHFENGEKSDVSKIWGSFHTIPAQFENGRKFDSKNSLQVFDAKEKYLHPKNRPVSIQKRRKMCFVHHCRVLTRCCFKFIPVRVPFSKSIVVESAGKKCAVFVWTGGLSVTFFTIFKMCRHHVNAVSVHTQPACPVDAVTTLMVHKNGCQDKEDKFKACWL